MGKPIHILLFLDIFTFHVFSELMTQNSDISSENGNGYLFDQFEKLINMFLNPTIYFWSVFILFHFIYLYLFYLCLFSLYLFRTYIYFYVFYLLTSISISRDMTTATTSYPPAPWSAPFIWTPAYLFFPVYFLMSSSYVFLARNLNLQCKS